MWVSGREQVTNFGVLLQICGMTPHDAALFLSTPPRVIIRWTRGVGQPATEAVAALGALLARQQEVADAIINSWDEAGRPASLSIAVARDDEEARSMGWPSLAAQIAPTAIAQAVLAPIRINLDNDEAAGIDPAGIAAE